MSLVENPSVMIDMQEILRRIPHRYPFLFIDRGEDFLKIKDMAIKRGMRTLRQSALRRLAEGTTTFEEVVRVTGI